MRFVIISTQRSGSTFLRTSLDSHPNIRCHGEVFLSHYGEASGYREFYDSNWMGRIRHIVKRKKLVFSYLDQLYSGSDLKVTATGFKAMYGQLKRLPYRYPMLLDYIKSNDVAVIHHIRENPLHTLISRYRLGATGIAHAKSDKDHLAAQTKLKINTATLISDLNGIQSQKNWWKKRLYRFNCIEVRHEDFVSNTEFESRRILSFIGADENIVLQSPLKKIGTKPYQETLLNYSEVVNALMNTKYEQYLS